MKPFGMESVLKYRQQLEDIARQKLFKTLEEEANLLNIITTTESQLTSLYKNLEADRQQGTTVDRLILFENRISTVQEQLTGLKTELEKLGETVARRRRQLLKASQEKKVLEKLREQQNLAYRRYLDKKEAAMLDEVAVLFHQR